MVELHFAIGGRPALGLIEPVVDHRVAIRVGSCVNSRRLAIAVQADHSAHLDAIGSPVTFHQPGLRQATRNGGLQVQRVHLHHRDGHFVAVVEPTRTLRRPSLPSRQMVGLFAFVRDIGVVEDVRRLPRLPIEFQVDAPLLHGRSIGNQESGVHVSWGTSSRPCLQNCSSRGAPPSGSPTIGPETVMVLLLTTGGVCCEAAVVASIARPRHRTVFFTR